MDDELARRELISTITGYLSIGAWLFAQFPQVLQNFRNGSVEGLALPFLVSWLFGDVTNLIGCILTHQLLFQTILASYFCFVDFCLISQYYYYTVIRPPVHVHHHHHHAQRQETSESRTSRTRRRSHSQSQSQSPTISRKQPRGSTGVVGIGRERTSFDIGTGNRVVASWNGRPGIGGVGGVEGGDAAADGNVVDRILPRRHRGDSRRGYVGHNTTGSDASDNLDGEDTEVPADMQRSFTSAKSARTVNSQASSSNASDLERGRGRGRTSTATAPFVFPPVSGTEREGGGVGVGVMSKAMGDRSQSRKSRPSMTTRTSSVVFLGVFALAGFRFLSMSGEGAGTSSGTGTGTGVRETARAWSGVSRLPVEVQGILSEGLDFRNEVPVRMWLASRASSIHPPLHPAIFSKRQLHTVAGIFPALAVRSVPSDDPPDAFFPSYLLPPNRTDVNGFVPIASAQDEQERPLDLEHVIGRISAWICTTLYLTSRMPQIWKNFRRQSVEGLSLSLFIMAAVANILYVVSILTNPLVVTDGTPYILESIPYILGSGGTVCFDMTICIQAFLYRHGPRRRHRRCSHSSTPGKASRKASKYVDDEEAAGLLNPADLEDEDERMQTSQAGASTFAPERPRYRSESHSMSSPSRSRTRTRTNSGELDSAITIKPGHAALPGTSHERRPLKTGSGAVSGHVDAEGWDQVVDSPVSFPAGPST